MSTFLKNFFLSLLILLMVSSSGLFSQNSLTNDMKYLDAEGEYLGQQPPGNIPELFAPGIICTGMDDRDITVSPDGKDIFFGVLEKPHYVLIWLKEENGKWLQHQIAPFSGKYNDYEPQFSPDGERLYFCSDRPVEGTGDPKDSDIWYVQRTKDGWSDPINIGPPVNTEKNEFYPSLTKTGTMYFTSHDMKICRSEFKDGKYQEPEILSDSINTRAEYNAFIDPDEKYLIYTSHSWGYASGRGDLFISYKKEDGSWSTPRHLGENVNSTSMEMSPSVSSDGKYLFFSSKRTDERYDPRRVTSYKELLKSTNKSKNNKSDIYWIDAKMLFESQ